MMGHEISCAATMLDALARIDEFEAELRNTEIGRNRAGYQFKARGLTLYIEDNEAFDMTGDGDYVTGISIDMQSAQKLLAPLRETILARLLELGVEHVGPVKADAND